jgi:DNA (cytosine-5)-methyltransferase 1
VGGFDLGLELAGWETKWQVEINEYRRQVLARHWPEVQRYPDIRDLDADALERVDMVCGGFPCQDLSVAGSRAGLAGSESGLWYEYHRVVAALRPRWVFIENVPGLLSQNEGRDMEIIVNGLTELRYGVSWTILDSQYFGVPQRRRRVFIVGHLGAPCPPEVLFERESLRGDTETGRETGSEVAGAAEVGAERYDGETDADLVVNARQDPITPDLPSLDTDGGSWAVRTANTSSNGHGIQRDLAPTLRKRWDGSPSGTDFPLAISTPHDSAGVGEASSVPRSLDAATADSKRYAALGDAVTVSVIEWIGKRILEAL